MWYQGELNDDNDNENDIKMLFFFYIRKVIPDDIEKEKKNVTFKGMAH